MADLIAIRSALAAQITAHTGLRADAQARDQITPPVAVILPGQPLIQFGETMDEALTISLVIVIIISDAPPLPATQRALDSYIGLDHGDGSGASIPAAVLKDTTLSGTVEYCEPTSVSSYGRIDYAGVGYFGARINLQIGAI